MEQVLSSREVKKKPSNTNQSFFGASTSEPFFSGAIQPKLAIGAVNDPCEQEADAVASQVMRMDAKAPATGVAPSLASSSPLVRRSPGDGDVPGQEVAPGEAGGEASEAVFVMDAGGDSGDAGADEEAPAITQTPDAPIQPKCAHCEEEEKKTGLVQRKCAHCEEEQKMVQRKCAHCDSEEQEKGLVQRKGIHEVSGKSSPCISCGHDAVIPVQRKANDGGSNSASVESTLQSSGQPMDGSTRQFMESRFGQDFSQVQIHNDNSAHQSANSINAHAYTHQHHVVFGAGQYQPGTNSGKQLLAHELTHVVQQGKGVSRKVIQRQKKPTDMVTFQVTVPNEFTTDAQMFRLFERIAFQHETNDTWSCASGPDCGTIAKNRGKTVTFQVARSTIQAATTEDDKKKAKDGEQQYGALPPTQKDKVNKEADKRYHEETNTKEGEQIKKGEEGKATQWKRKMEDIMAEKKALEALPPDLKALMGGERTFDPKDHEQLLRIAAKLKSFTPEDIAVYKLLTLKATDNLDLFEKSVDMFLARKEAIKEAMKNQPPAPAPADPKDKGPASMEEAIEGAWDGFDAKAYAGMNEQQRLDLAMQERNKVTKAQLKYMKDHPGEMAVDFVKSATLVNTGETLSGAAKDLAEAANGDANTWARFAGGAGAGAKISGWLMAVGGVLYVLSWLTGVGELATIAAGMAYLLAANVVLSAAESDLRMKAASQAKTPEEHMNQVNKGAAALTNVLVALGTLALALALHFVAKTFFPKQVKAVSESLARFREKVRISGGIEPAKVELSTDMEAHKTKLSESGAAAKKEAAATADSVEKMGTDEFVEKLEAGKEDYAQAPADKGQKMPWREMAKTPEGRKAIQTYKNSLVNELRNTVPAEIDAQVKGQVDAIDAMVAKAKAATTPTEFADALGDFEKYNSPEAAAERGKQAQEKMRQQKIDEALKDIDQPKKGPEIEKQSKSNDNQREVKMTKDKKCIVCASPCDEIKAKFKEQIERINNSGGKDYNALLDGVEKNAALNDEQRFEAYKKLEQEIADSRKATQEAMRGKKDVQIFEQNGPDKGKIITDIDAFDIEGDTLWEEKSATSGKNLYTGVDDTTGWVAKHVTTKFMNYMKARAYIAGFEKSSIGFRFTSKGAEASFMAAVEAEVARLRGLYPDVDIKTNWAK